MGFVLCVSEYSPISVFCISMAILNPIFDYSLWIIFSLFVGIALTLDLGVLTKSTSILKGREQTFPKKEKRNCSNSKRKMNQIIP